MYPIRNSAPLNDCERRLTIAEVIIGDKPPHDPVVLLSSNFAHQPFFHFVIFESDSGAFQSSDFYKPEELCLQHYQDAVRWKRLQYKILIEFIPRFKNPDNLQWRVRVIPWIGKNREGKAISIICGSELALTLLEKTLKETQL